MQLISEDVSRKDIRQLRKHYQCLKENTAIILNILPCISSLCFQCDTGAFQEDQFSGERRIEHEIDRLYNCRNIMEILEVTEENIREYESFLERSMSESRNEVAAVKIISISIMRKISVWKFLRKRYIFHPGI